MARGKFIVDRAILAHPALQDRRAPRWCRRAAFVDLVSMACWKPHKVDIIDKTVILERGELSHSTRYLADRWGWSEAGVRRFLDRLQTDGLIVAAADAGQTVIRIKNYHEMQRLDNTSDAVTDAPTVAEATQVRRKEEHQDKHREDPKKDGVVDHGRERPSIVALPETGMPMCKNIKVKKSTTNSNRVFELKEIVPRNITIDDAVSSLLNGFSIASPEFSPTEIQRTEFKALLAPAPYGNLVKVLSALERVVLPHSGTHRITNPARWCRGAIENQDNGGLNVAAE
ncbi:MAG: hypothetical protein J0H39_03870 [Alphaproteobacteria bacterium]|nr:hypothetical protein [Alphaproteobacteria bacterium]